jgi:hypothetical protein
MAGAADFGYCCQVHNGSAFGALHKVVAQAVLVVSFLICLNLSPPHLSTRCAVGVRDVVPLDAVAGQKLAVEESDAPPEVFDSIHTFTLCLSHLLSDNDGGIADNRADDNLVELLHVDDGYRPTTNQRAQVGPHNL